MIAWHIVFVALFLLIVLVFHWRRKSFTIRLIALFIFIIGTAVSWIGLEYATSHPRDMEIAALYEQKQEPFVVASMLVPGKAIYLMLLFPETDEPRLYKMPWSDKAAKDLREAMKEAKKKGSPGIIVPFPYRHGLRKHEKLFHPLPQRPNPPKMERKMPETYKSPKYDI